MVNSDSWSQYLVVSIDDLVEDYAWLRNSLYSIVTTMIFGSPKLA